MSLRVLVLEDQLELRRAIERHLKRQGAEVFGTDSVNEAVEAMGKYPGFHAAIVDLWLPDGRGLDVLERLPSNVKRPACIVMTGEATVETAVGALRIGAVDYLMKPFSMEALDAALARVISGPARSVVASIDTNAIQAWRRRYAPEMLGEHASLLRVFDVLSRVADTDCSVLVHGETGTGKELVARAIHAASGRGERPFIAVNCAAVPEQLMESELFGHSRGAFTGATTQRIGRFAAAHKGTLFMDEIGEMPLLVQAKLLRALQEKEITPLGESKPMDVDVRVIAATHRDLEEASAQKTFREDLLYRLDVIRVELPPLRARKEDISALVDAFIRQTNERRDRKVKGIDGPAMDILRNYTWPGNVRQLQNIIERVVLLRGDGTITKDDIPEKLRGPAKAEMLDEAGLPQPVLPDHGIDLREAVERFESALIRQALERTSWNKNRAATILHMNRTTLVEKLKKKGWTDNDEESS